MTHLTQWARGVALCAVFAAMFAAFAPKSAEARVVETRTFGLWEYQHFIGDIEWCGVKTNWPNDSMVLTIRLRRDALDFFFYNQDWNLTTHRRMGDTIFVFGRSEFYADTETLDSNRAVFGTFRTRIGDFVARFKGARNMKLEFPTNQSLNVNLRGSSRAMDAAVSCWNRRLNY